MQSRKYLSAVVQYEEQNHVSFTVYIIRCFPFFFW